MGMFHFCSPLYQLPAPTLYNSPLFPPPPHHPCNMSAQPLQAFLDQTRVTVVLNPSTHTSSISLALVSALNLPCVFTETGRQSCSAMLIVPTIGGFFRSRLDFAVGYALPADVLGNDWIVPYRPIFLECSPLPQPMPHSLDGLEPPHFWYTGAGSSLSLRLLRVLTASLAPVDLSQKIWDSNAGAFDAFLSLITECYLNNAFCFDLLNDHAIALNDACDERRVAVLVHLLNGSCALVPSTPSCKLLARGASSTTHLSYRLCSLLLTAHQNAPVPVEISSLCCGSIGLHATTTTPGHELRSKLEQQLRYRKPLIKCRDMFGTLNGLVLFGNGSLSELISLRGIELNFSTKDAACDTLVHHLITGACDNVDGELCLLIHSTFRVVSSGRSKPVNLQLHILDGVLKTVNRKHFYASCVSSISLILLQILSQSFDPRCEGTAQISVPARRQSGLSIASQTLEEIVMPRL